MRFWTKAMIVSIILFIISLIKVVSFPVYEVYVPNRGQAFWIMSVQLWGILSIWSIGKWMFEKEEMVE